MRSRLVAVVGAVAMIVAAVAVRSAIDDSGGGGSAGTGPGQGGGAVVCDRALADACPDGAELADGRAKAAALMAADIGPRSWISLGPWPQMVDETRRLQSREALFPRATAVASTHLVAVVKKGRLGCQPVTWRCIGDAAAAKALSVAGPDAATSLGLLVRVAAVSGFLGGPPASAADVTEVPAAMTWLGGLETAIADGRQRGNTDLATWISQFPASTDVFLTTEADAAAIAGSRIASQVELAVPAPAVVAEVVVGESARGGFDTASLRDRLTGAGWSTAPVSGTSGLPSPDVLYALDQVIR